jgi:hypothetical protein
LKIDSFEPSAGIRAFYRLYAARFGKKRCGDKTPVYAAQMPENRDSPVGSALYPPNPRRQRRGSVGAAAVVRAGKGHPEYPARLEKSNRTNKISKRELPALSRNSLRRLVTDTETELRKACAFIERGYHPQMLCYFKGARARLDEVAPRYRPDGTLLISKEERLFNHRFTSSPPDRSRIFRWRREMTNEERREFETEAGDLLQILGYEIQSPTKSICGSRCASFK